MTYPPAWRVATDPELAPRLMAAHPFGQLVTGHDGVRCTRIPFVVDADRDRPVRLRAHLNRHNPQVRDLDGASALVVFSGPSTYVSPHWRASKTRAGTFDYEEVQVRGVVQVVDDLEFFRQLIDDLSQLIEPRYADVGDYPVWRTSMAPAGYLERLFPQVTSFAIDVESIDTVSKLHQQFPLEDREAVADHLARSSRDDSRAIGARIRADITRLARDARREPASATVAADPPVVTRPLRTP